MSHLCRGPVFIVTIMKNLGHMNFLAVILVLPYVAWYKEQAKHVPHCLIRRLKFSCGRLVCHCSSSVNGALEKLIVKWQ